MSSSYGSRVRVTLFGQSHSEGVGVVIDGLPAGDPVDLGRVQAFLDRRAPGRNDLSTARRESDVPQILSGIEGGVTCGAPLCAVFENADIRSGDYDALRDVPRPGHADYPAFVKHKGHNDIRGGGHFSARLTAPLCFAGAVCLGMLESRGVLVAAHIASIADADDAPFDPVDVRPEQFMAVVQKPFPVLDDGAGEAMRVSIRRAAAAGDSVGGVVECCALGLPVGLGEPIFDGLENRIAQAVFGIPAVRGIEFGAGFAAAKLLGSQHNDAYIVENGQVRTRTNRHGGVLGGLSTGMPLLFRAAFKPTASIALQQESVSLLRGESAPLSVRGRHDPCVVPRAVPCVEAAAAIAILDSML